MRVALLGKRFHVQLTNEAAESLHGDETLTLFVIEPEGVPQLLLHGLHVGVLDEEGGAQLAELSKLNLTRAVLVHLSQR